MTPTDARRPSQLRDISTSRLYCAQHVSHSGRIQAGIRISAGFPHRMQIQRLIRSRNITAPRWYGVGGVGRTSSVPNFSFIHRSRHGTWPASSERSSYSERSLTKSARIRPAQPVPPAHSRIAFSSSSACIRCAIGLAYIVSSRP